MGGVEETILKHKVKAKDKDHLTNKKPKLDIMSQDRIPILWIETKQAKILYLFKCIKSSQKLGRVTTICGWIPDYKTKSVIIKTRTQKQTSNPMSWDKPQEL